MNALNGADAIVLGCPTYMGSVSAPFKAFMDSTVAVWALQGWRDKLAAGFTHSAAPSGDKLATLLQLAVFAAQHGMIWVGLGLPPTHATTGAADDTNRLGSHLGAMAQSPPGGRLPDGDLVTAELLGRRVGDAAQRWGTRVAAPSQHHPTARTWAFPPADRPPLPAGLERTNLRELVARPDRFEHHLIVCASIGSAQLEIVTASEPLYFGHINISDEYALALPTGDDVIDKFPLGFRTFITATDGTDVARYKHKVGDLVLHPLGYQHWPGRLRPPYEPFAIPPGMRRTGLSLVYCASVPTASAKLAVPLAPERRDDVKVYAGAPHLVLSDLRVAGPLAAIGTTTLELVIEPRELAPPRGGWVVVLDTGDLIRIPAGARLPGAGIQRALVFTGDAPPDPVPPSWHALPPPPFAPFEDAPPGTLPLAAGDLLIEEVSPTEVALLGARVPRYWLARTLFRLALHGLRLGTIETYGGLVFDDRDDLIIRGRTQVTIPRGEALALIERMYRAVAPAGYTERLL
jgi:NAD(P)H dehydrogenase (quinone)